MPNTIILRGDTAVIREEIGNEAITPGMLVDFAANDRLCKHATSGAYAARMFAIERDFIGASSSTTSGGYTVTTAYASGERVVYADCHQGIIVWAHLASGQNVAKGDILMSNGAGFLTARTSTNIGLAQADEDANASTGIAAGGSLRFRARVI